MGKLKRPFHFDNKAPLPNVCRDRLSLQLCLLFWLGGTPLLPAGLPPEWGH